MPKYADLQSMVLGKSLLEHQEKMNLTEEFGHLKEHELRRTSEFIRHPRVSCPSGEAETFEFGFKSPLESVERSSGRFE